MITRTTHSSDVKTLRRDRIDLAVAMTRDQNLGGILLEFQERHHEMLAVPERDDNRHVRLDVLVDIRRIEGEAVCPPYKPQKFGRSDARSTLHPARTT